MQTAVKSSETLALNALKQAHFKTADMLAKTPATRAQELLDEAKGAAAEHIALLDAALTKVGAIASEIAMGGDIYPAGVRDLCRRLNDDMSLKSKTIAVILRKTGALSPSRHRVEN
jgi:hypothetical protein